MLVRMAVCLLVVLGSAGCASSRSESPPITVEGTLTRRGNEPFTGLWLETGMRTFYVLVMDDATAAGIVTPSTYRATGMVYLDDWNGYPMAHLAVRRLDRVE